MKRSSTSGWVVALLAVPVLLTAPKAVFSARKNQLERALSTLKLR